MIAVLGGGQLAQMLALASAPLGERLRCWDPDPSAPAAAVSDLLALPWDDPEAVARLAQGAHCATCEFEHVPLRCAERLAALMPVSPTPRVLAIKQDRLLEKRALEELGLPVAPWCQVDGPEDLAKAVRMLGPVVAKTRHGGYDGRGQAVLRASDEAASAWTTLAGRPLIAERMMTFSRECSLIAVRGRDGTMACWPLTSNRHREGVLRLSLASDPAVAPGQQAEAEAMARRLLEAWEHVGVLAIEFFAVDGRLVVNEVAPRVHNSGHWTIEGAVTSQFANHCRALAGLPLGDTSARGPAAMVNCLGSLPDASAVLAIPGTHLHRYGKLPRPGRKLGHITVIADDQAELNRRLAKLQAACGQPEPLDWIHP